jgi:hypothetical protein
MIMTTARRRPKELITMPRNLRRVSLILAVALSLGLANHASHAANLAPRANAAEAAGTGLFDAVWSWFTSRFAGASFLLSSHPRPGGLGTRKDGGASDPNGNGGSSLGSTSAGHGGTVVGGLSIQTAQP